MPKQFRVTGTFHFRNGEVVKRDWIEDKLVKRDKEENQPTSEPLSLEEVEHFFSKKFEEHKAMGKTLTVKNIKNFYSAIPFNEVTYYEFSVVQLDEVSEEEPKNTSNIEDHPAFKGTKGDNS